MRTLFQDVSLTQLTHLTSALENLATGTPTSVRPLIHRTSDTTPHQHIEALLAYLCRVLPGPIDCLVAYRHVSSAFTVWRNSPRSAEKIQTVSFRFFCAKFSSTVSILTAFRLAEYIQIWDPSSVSFDSVSQKTMHYSHLYRFRFALLLTRVQQPKIDTRPHRDPDSSLLPRT